MQELEEKIEDAMMRRDAIAQQAITLEGIYKIMVNFDCVYNIISDEEKRAVVTALIKEIELYRNDESECPLKRIGLNFPVFKDGKEVSELLWDKGNTVETVCLLTREKSVKSYAYVDITPSELGMGGKVKKPTYKQIQAYVLETHGLKVSPLYIANVKDEFGLEKQFSYEEAGMSAKKRPNCPSEKRAAIIDALIHFGMLDEDARETE